MKRMMKPSHPGAILREDVIKEMNLTVTEVAENLNISRVHLSRIINEIKDITPEMAFRLDSVSESKHNSGSIFNQNMICGK